jgi:hypothetical protein
MLNAYSGKFSDRYPVAPEFWYFFPAKVLGVNMVEFEREIPLWQALHTTFKKYGTEGWGAVFPSRVNPDVDKRNSLVKISDTQYREITVHKYQGKELQTSRLFDVNEPSWLEEHLAKSGEELSDCMDMLLNHENEVDFNSANSAWACVGEDYLLEMWMGTPFFDFIGELMGFEQAVLYFLNEDEKKLEEYRDRYIAYQKEFIGNVCRNTDYESFVIGCSYSCNSLIGPNMWRQWDKPYIKEMAGEIHKYGKLLHIHFHGRSIETAADFAEIGIDCVCPFERGPGGDVNGPEGLREVRRLLDGKVTMNGNIHTVDTLIKGTPEDVRREVRQIREAFNGSPRLIIGSGDQVGRETSEENILAMIDEAKRG